MDPSLVGAPSVNINDVHHTRSKHIDVRHHFIRDAIISGKVCMEYVPTEDQLADILTKGLGRIRHQELRDQIMG